MTPGEEPSLARRAPSAVGRVIGASGSPTADVGARSTSLPLSAVALMVLASAIWGVNLVAIKVSSAGIPPILTATVRNGGAAVLVGAYIALRGGPLLHRDVRLLHGLGLAAVFAVNFLCVYVGTALTDASRAVVLLYTQPLFTALLAHFLLKGDRLNRMKSAGLALAFGGVAAVFLGRSAGGSGSLAGDALVLAGGFFWALNTVYAKWALHRYDIHPRSALLYQLALSAPLLLGASALLEAGDPVELDGLIIASVVFQLLVVATISYLVWFHLVERYPVSRLTSFLLLTPFLGVVAGWALLGEQIDAFLAVGLVLVLLGLYLVNVRAAEPADPAGTGLPPEELHRERGEEVAADGR